MILIFKTNITRTKLSMIDGLVHSTEPKAEWNVDLEDCDKVLRIVTANDCTHQIITSLRLNGILCEELQD